MDPSKLFNLIPRLAKSVEKFWFYGRKCAIIVRIFQHWGKMHENFQIIVETSSWSQIKDNFILKNNV